MTPDKAQLIKNWMKRMGFKLTQRHVTKTPAKRINYYTLDNYGVYEEISAAKQTTRNTAAAKKQKFISWTPWGIDFEITSVRDLSRAYAEFLNYNPDVVIN